jgi:lantibiotic biosynthesis protein
MTTLPDTSAILHQQLLAVLAKINTAIDLDQPYTSQNVTLWLGKPGLALYLTCLHDVAGDVAHVNEAGILSLISSILDEIGTYATPLFLKNIWTLWAARAVNDFFDSTEHARALRELDEMLLEALLEVDVWEQPYDLVYGLVGIGAYGLTASNDSCGTQIVERVFELLMTLACETEQYLWWPTNQHLGPADLLMRGAPGYRDLGLAHGNAGVLALLARAVKQNQQVETASRCINKLAPWLIAQQNPPACATRFPYIAEESNVPSRCAWCYGDVGITWALLCAGDAMQQAPWIAFAKATAQNIIARPLETMGFADSGLCHGHAGVGHILRRMGDYFNDPAISAFAQTMLHKAMLSLDDPATAAAIAPNNAYLEGQTGIGLALISATATLKLHWDYPLLLA